MSRVIECLVVNEPESPFPEGVTPRHVALFDADGAPIHLGAGPRAAVDDVPNRATASQLAATVNELLGALRAAGVIATD